MKLELHPASERGISNHGWLTSRFSFSFADWYNPARMGFRALRVLNDDHIAPSSGFGMHPHRDMEIITIVTKGAVTHEDSMGNHGAVQAGEVQVMSAGMGVVHGERNDSRTEPLELFQLWIMTRTPGIVPRYDQRAFASGAPLLVSPDGREGSLSIMQDAFITRRSVGAGETLTYPLYDAKNGVYVFVISGGITIDNLTLGARDAVGIEDAESIELRATDNTTILLVEVP